MISEEIKQQFRNAYHSTGFAQLVAAQGKIELRVKNVGGRAKTTFIDKRHAEPNIQTHEIDVDEALRVFPIFLTAVSMSQAFSEGIRQKNADENKGA